MSENFYQFNINQLNGDEISLSEFKGKVVLIVNTASNCGLTYHYTGIEKLYQEYKDNGLVIIGFPCNQFGKQEPGTSEEIQKFCISSEVPGSCFPNWLHGNPIITNPLSLYSW